MSERLTDKELAKLERLERIVHPGPWFEYDSYGILGVAAEDSDHLVVMADNADESEAEYARVGLAMEFIATVRNALPSLIAEVRASRAARAESEGTRLPPPPGALVGAQHDRVHKEVGNSRPAHVARATVADRLDMALRKANALRAPPPGGGSAPASRESEGTRCVACGSFIGCRNCYGTRSEGTGEEPAAVPYTGSRARRSVGNCPCGGELVQLTDARTPQAQCLKCKAWRWPAPASRDGQGERTR